MTTTRKGKIARLPLAIREELNLRLLNGEGGPKILRWLNESEEVKAVLEEDFEGLSVNDQNLSDWRKGGYEDWLRKRDRLDQVREMSQWSMKLAKAGGKSMSENAAAILAGNILQVLEEVSALATVVKDGAEPKDAAANLALMGEMTGQLTLAVSRLRKGDHSAEALRIAQERLDQTGEQLKLERQKFELLVCNKLLDLSKLELTLQIAKSDLGNAEKIAALRKAYFSDVDALEQSGEVKLPE